MGSEPNDQLEVVQLLYMNLFIYFYLYQLYLYVCKYSLK